MKTFFATYVWWIVGLAFAALLGVAGTQTVRLAGAKTDLATEQADRAIERAKALQVASDYKDELADLKDAHAKTQQTNEDKYVKDTNTLKDRNTALTADNKRMLGDIAAYTSGGRRAGETDAAFCQRQGNRLQVVGTLLGEGVELETESRLIIENRDAEVALLLGQIKADRQACSPGN